MAGERDDKAALSAITESAIGFAARHAKIVATKDWRASI
jgi:hypothetical protein